MDRETFPGRWLLVDAAGPTSVVGLVTDGSWVDRRESEGDFLEWFHPAVAGLLAVSGTAASELKGVLYAGGPGSTLGLRLAAIYLRTLLCLEDYSHWHCGQYQNLEVAAVALGEEELVAPWRKDRWHRSCLKERSPLRFANDWTTPREATELGLKGVQLGRRPPATPEGFSWAPYPIDAVPKILWQSPELLHAVECPTPYTAEEPEFVRWSRQRHTGK